MFRSTKKTKDGDTQNFAVRCYTEKNKIAPAFRTANIWIELGYGLGKELEIMKLGDELGVYRKKGGYYYFTNGETYDAHGEDSATQFLRDNPEIFDQINEEVREKYGNV
jgi:recombination protein RecA